MSSTIRYYLGILFLYPLGCIFIPIVLFVNFVIAKMPISRNVILSIKCLDILCIHSFTQINQRFRTSKYILTSTFFQKFSLVSVLVYYFDTFNDQHLIYLINLIIKFQAKSHVFWSCFSIACHVLKEMLPKQVMVIKNSRYTSQNCVMYISPK